MKKINDFIEEFKRLTDQELMKELYNAVSNKEAAKKIKKNDHKLEKLNDEIKKVKEEALTSEYKKAKELLKEYSDKVKSLTSDLQLTKKAESAGHDNSIKEFSNQEKAILRLLKQRRQR